MGKLTDVSWGFTMSIRNIDFNDLDRDVNKKSAVRKLRGFQGGQK